MAFAAGNAGFWCANDANSTTYRTCLAQANSGNGFTLRGCNSAIVGGSSQLNHGYGIAARDGSAQKVQGVYIEGNARSIDYPVSLYAANTTGLTIEQCYFHGVYPRASTNGHSKVCRAINVHDSHSPVFRENLMVNFSNGAFALFNTDDPDLNIGTHTLESAPLFGIDPYDGGCTRVRSNGIILPTDLSSVDGAYTGDVGYHKDATSQGIAVWCGGCWNLAQTSAL